MLRGIFVSGTDTNVGKTVVSAALMLRYPSARYWKPVQTGAVEDDDTATVSRLTAGRANLFEEGARFAAPLSPHLAARLEGREITMDAVLAPIEKAPPSRWVVEGAGGVLVPLNDREDMVALMSALAVPVLVVSRSTLGTINHTRLTLEALRARALEVAGVVMVGPPNVENRRAIERYGHARVLGELPLLDPLDADALQSWAVEHLDPMGHLAPWLT